MKIKGLFDILKGLVVPKIYPPEDSISALQIMKADGATTVVAVDTINEKVTVSGDIFASNLSGTNTGDETQSTIKTKLGAAEAGVDGYLTGADWSTFNGKQADLGYTAEDVANKSTSVSTDGTSDIKYPSVKAVKTYADNLIVGLLNYRGGYDASGDAYPTTGGSGFGGAVAKGDMWVISVAGVLGGKAIQVGDTIISSVASPGQTSTNWNTLNTNITYVPEDVANKSNDVDLTADSDTLYPTQHAVKTYADTKEPLIGYTTENVANKSTSISTDGTSDTKYPTVKAVKDYADNLVKATYLTFNNTTSWGSPTNGVYSMTYLASSHGMGTAPVFMPMELISGNLYERVQCETEIVDMATGDITIKVSQIPDGRFAGRIIVK